MADKLWGLAMLVPCIVWLYEGPPPELFAWYKSKAIVAIGICACPFMPRLAGWAFAFSYIFLLIGCRYDMIWGQPNQYQGLMVWLSYLSIFSLALHNKKQTRVIMVCLLVSVAAVSMVGFAQLLGFQPIDWLVFGGSFKRYSITSTLYNENFVGHFGGMICPFLLVCFLRSQKYSLTALILLLTMLLVLILSRSLIGIASAFMSCAIVAGLHIRSFRIGLFCIFIAVSAVAANIYIERRSISNLTSLGNRSYLWTHAIADTRIVGHGPDQLAMRWHKTAPISSQLKTFKKLTFPDRAHGLYVGIAHAFGWSGLVLYLIFVGEYLLRGLRLRVWGLRRPIYFACWSAVLGYHIAGIANDSGVFVSPVMWALFGLGYYIPGKKKYVRLSK